MKNLVKCSLSVLAADEEPIVRKEGDNLETDLKELNCFHSIGRGKNTYTRIMHASLNPNPWRMPCQGLPGIIISWCLQPLLLLLSMWALSSSWMSFFNLFCCAFSQNGTQNHVCKIDIPRSIYKKKARSFEWINGMEIHPLVKWVSWKYSNFSAEIANSMTKKNVKLFEKLWTKIRQK